MLPHLGSDEVVEAPSEEVSRTLRRLRQARGVSQRELARLVGTSPSVICRLEDESYHGHSLEMLRRVAAALGTEVHVRFSRLAAAEAQSQPDHEPG